MKGLDVKPGSRTDRLRKVRMAASFTVLKNPRNGRVSIKVIGSIEQERRYGFTRMSLSREEAKMLYSQLKEVMEAGEDNAG